MQLKYIFYICKLFEAVISYVLLLKLHKITDTPILNLITPREFKEVL